MNICFVLPELPRRPVGGYLIVFQYANRLAERKHNVSVLFANKDTFKSKIKYETLRKLVIRFCMPFMPRWFKLNSRIKKYSFFQKKTLSKLENIDVCFATGIATVADVKRFFMKKCKTFYLIQDFENWEYDDEFVLRSYKSGLHNIVISNWLKKIVEDSCKKEAVLIANPIDTNLYKCVNGPKKRDKNTICACYNSNPIKGGTDLLETLYLVKKREERLKVLMFGRSKKPKNLPKWIKYYKNASSKKTIEIYNTASVFVCASIKEGFGLPGLEAMSCGACLVSTEYDGVLEYGKNMVNCLLSPVRNPGLLATNTIMAMENLNLRLQLVRNGIKSSKARNWDKAVDALEIAIKKQYDY